MIHLCDYVNILHITVLFINNLFFVNFRMFLGICCCLGVDERNFILSCRFRIWLKTWYCFIILFLLDITLRLNLNMYWRLLLGIWRSHFNSCLKFILAGSVVSSPLTNNEMWLVWLPTPCLPLLCFSCVSFLCFCIYISSLFIIWCPGLWRS